MKISGISSEIRRGMLKCVRIERNSLVTWNQYETINANDIHLIVCFQNYCQGQHKLQNFLSILLLITM